MFRLLLLMLAWPALVQAQDADSLHIVVDGQASGSQPCVYRTFQEAAAHLVEGVTVSIRPGVYWIDDPDDPAVRIGQNGREPFGMVVRCKALRLVGLGREPGDVVLASRRGQTQGAVGNFTMFDFWCDRLEVENLTMGNYCNVDLVYPLDPRQNRRRRSDAITQAHVGYVHGDSLIARRVHFISRLNLNPLNGARHSYYEDCHFECTDDALNGTATYRHCDFHLYGSKPWWSTHGKGALLIDCDFYAMNDNRETYFCKQGGPLTLVNCRYHAPSDSTYIGWTAYPQPWLRCYQQDFTLNGRPYLVGHRQPQNTVLIHDYSVGEPPFLPISQHEATLLTGRDTLLLTAPSCQWRVQPGFEQYVALRPAGRDTLLVIPTNGGDDVAHFCIEAYTGDGRTAACELTVKPSELPPPAFVEAPHIVIADGTARVDYTLDLTGAADASTVVWYKTATTVRGHDGADDLVLFAVGRSIVLTDAEVGHALTAQVLPCSSRSLPGTPTRAQGPPALVRKRQVNARKRLETDFSNILCDWQPRLLPGFWTVDGYKPADTAEFPWSFDSAKPMWQYGEGFNGAVGKGLLQAQRGARLMYTPVENVYGDMHLTLHVDPTKTAGQGFGSATGQYMDVCLKFDTRTLTGYGLRIVRTTKHAKAVDFLLVGYNHGVVTPLTPPVSATCYRTGCTIDLRADGDVVTAHVETTTPKPADSSLPHVVDLQARVTANPFGGIHIQHTGSCGESTTMLHRLAVQWQ